MRAAKTLIIFFLVTLFVYITAYTWIEHLRIQNGPWEITFTSETNAPAIVINQPALNIHDVKIIFPDATATNATETIMFDQAHQVPFPMPLGDCVFLDTTTLPGTVTLKVFSHEIQLLPRVLTIDRKERAWQSDAVIPLPAKP